MGFDDCGRRDRVSVSMLCTRLGFDNSVRRVRGSSVHSLCTAAGERKRQRNLGCTGYHRAGVHKQHAAHILYIYGGIFVGRKVRYSFDERTVCLSVCPQPLLHVSCKRHLTLSTGATYFCTYSRLFPKLECGFKGVTFFSTSKRNQL